MISKKLVAVLAASLVVGSLGAQVAFAHEGHGEEMVDGAKSEDGKKMKGHHPKHHGKGKGKAQNKIDAMKGETPTGAESEVQSEGAKEVPANAK